MEPDPTPDTRGAPGPWPFPVAKPAEPDPYPAAEREAIIWADEKPAVDANGSPV